MTSTGSLFANRDSVVCSHASLAGRLPSSSAVGTIRLRGAMQGDAYLLAIEDDGCGIDFPGVQARAAELGLIAPGARLSSAGCWT